MVVNNYLEYVNYIKEGLITTHDITKYNRILTDYIDDLNIKYNLSIVDKLKFYVELITNDYSIIESINHQSYTLGYFPSEYKLTLNNGMNNKFKDINNRDLTNVHKIEVAYEAKYEDGLYTNNIICPNKLYHLTSEKNSESIKKVGLYPKSKKRISVHPDRIYLFDDINNYNILLRNLKNSDIMNGIKTKYILLEIDSSNDKLILHTDPNYRFGYFTYDNISPSLIKEIKSNL
jgi:hypothetical protein